MTMTTTLQRALLGQGVTTIAQALGIGAAPATVTMATGIGIGGTGPIGTGPSAPPGTGGWPFGPGNGAPIGVLRMNADVAATCGTDLQLLGEDLGCPAMTTAERARLGRIDGNAELSRLRGNQQALGESKAVEQAAPVGAGELRELGDGYEAVELIGVGTRQMRRALGGGMLCVVGLITHIDRVTRGAVAELLGDGSMSEEERNALSAEFSPRLAMLQAEKEARDERLAKSERALGPLRRDAEDAEEEVDARAILTAAESGAALSPDEVLRALQWRRRRDEEDDAIEGGLLLAAEAPPERTTANRTARRGEARGRKGRR